MPAAGIAYEKIVEYWAEREDESELAVDWAEAHELCWRCACKARLQRCHIIPESLGGANEPCNLVLLCTRCHREAPNVNDSRIMWIWIRATAVGFYDSYWLVRGLQEFESMFGRKPFSGPEFTQIDPSHIQNLVRESTRRATIHFGEGRMGPSTIAGLCALIEERLTGTFPSPASEPRNGRYLLELIGLARSSGS